MSQQGPGWIEPVDVVEERNLLRQIENALGIDTADLDADDTVQLALLANAAHQGELLEQLANSLAGQAINPPPVNPQVDIQNVTAQLPQNVTLQGQLGNEPTNLLNVYDIDTQSSSDSILSQDLTPTSDHSAFRVTVTLDTTAEFRVWTKPPGGQSNFFTTLNGGAPIDADAKNTFTFQVDHNTEYNFRTGSAATVRELRVDEIDVVV